MLTLRGAVKTVEDRLPVKLHTVAGIAIGMAILFWPRKVNAPVYITTAQREKWYGPLQYRAEPTANNPEAIVVTNGFAEKNLVTEDMPIIGRVRIHKVAAPSLRKVLTEIQAKGWGHKIKRFAGIYEPRFVRKSTTNLSSHSYGTSIDINDQDNPQGGTPTQDQKDIAPIFEKHGWFWANNFVNSQPDPMHFEYVKPPVGMV